jgi:hypothetical protein
MIIWKSDERLTCYGIWVATLRSGIYSAKPCQNLNLSIGIANTLKPLIP